MWIICSSDDDNGHGYDNGHNHHGYNVDDTNHGYNVDYDAGHDGFEDESWLWASNAGLCKW